MQSLIQNQSKFSRGTKKKHLFIIFFVYTLFLLVSSNAYGIDYECVIKELKRFDKKYINNNFLTSNLKQNELIARKYSKTITSDSLLAICYLWIMGYNDYVELLWWKKDDPYARVLIVALVWCQFPAMTDAENTPEGIIPFNEYAERFQEIEKKNRKDEIALVLKMRREIAWELCRIMKSFNLCNSNLLYYKYKRTFEKLQVPPDANIHPRADEGQNKE